MKEGKTVNKYKDLARELKKAVNMKVRVIPIVLATLGTVSKNLKKDSMNYR